MRARTLSYDLLRVLQHVHAQVLVLLEQVLRRHVVELLPQLVNLRANMCYHDVILG